MAWITDSIFVELTEKMKLANNIFSFFIEISTLDYYMSSEMLKIIDVV